MDKSKMAQEGTVIHYDGRKGRNDQLSRPIKETCHEWCCCEDCQCDGKKSLDDTLNPPIEDDCAPSCC